ASRRKETGEGEFSTEVRYYISSLPLDAKLIAESVRTHWSIENNLHWQLDVTFREDNTRKTNNAAQNVSVMCKMALSLLKKDTKKASMVAKRKIAGWDEEYLARLLKTENF
ncbi:ISAs1 family transposase, partial [Macellibacteroides fermentans]